MWLQEDFDRDNYPRHMFRHGEHGSGFPTGHYFVAVSVRR